MDRNDHCRQFFTDLLPSFRAKYPAWKPHKLSKDYYYQCFPCSLRGTKYSVCFPGEPKNQLRVEIYIDHHNHDQFMRLYEARHRIESDLGERLCWECRVSKGKAARISLYFPRDIDIKDKRGWCELREWLIRTLGKMRRVVEPEME